MSNVRHISVFDSQRYLGAIVGNDRDYVARDTRGSKLGKFATVRQAADAISQLDNIKRVELTK